MADALNVIFHCFWHFVGTLVIVAVFGEAVSGLLARRVIIKQDVK